MKDHVPSLVELVKKFAGKSCLAGSHIAEDYGKTAAKAQFDQKVGQCQIMFAGVIKKFGVGTCRKRFAVKSENRIIAQGGVGINHYSDYR